MKKVDISNTKSVVLAIPPEPIDENEPICLGEYVTFRSNEKKHNHSKTRRFGEDSFKLKIGGTTYDVSTRFNPKGKQCVLDQFKKLILSENLI